MKQFENVLIITDFDGTFAGKDGRIVKENCDAIKYFNENGGHFTFASGRGPTKMKELFPEFVSLVNAPMVMVNGEMLYEPESDTVLEEHPLDSSLAIPIARQILMEMPKISINITDGVVYTSDRMPELGLKEDWRMMTCMGEADEVERCYNAYHEALNRVFTVRRPSPFLIDVTKKGVNKGTYIKVIREYFGSKGITDLKIICVGDYENDVDMLLSADVSVCPSNAIDKVKSICSHVLCDHDKGAIADLIKRLSNNEI